MRADERDLATGSGGGHRAVSSSASTKHFRIAAHQGLTPSRNSVTPNDQIGVVTPDNDSARHRRPFSRSHWYTSKKLRSGRIVYLPKSASGATKEPDGEPSKNLVFLPS